MWIPFRQCLFGFCLLVLPLTYALAAPSGVSAASANHRISGDRPECPGLDAVTPGRWIVESARVGEQPAHGRADIFRLQGGCIYLERLVIHFDDGTSHHTMFIHGWDQEKERRSLVQIGDHPLFLIWEQDAEASETYTTTRSAEQSEVHLRWVERPTPEGFSRALSVRRGTDTEWTHDETIDYRPLGPVEQLSDVPGLEPGPFHDPDACQQPEYREMDYLLGHWMNEEWVRVKSGGWEPETTSNVNVNTLIGGCAIMESHPVYHDGIPDQQLLLIRAFQPDNGQWKQVVFGHSGGVWFWDIRRQDSAWMLTPAEGDMRDRMRILEQPTEDGLEKTIELLQDDGTWRAARKIRYVGW